MVSTRVFGSLSPRSSRSGTTPIKVSRINHDMRDFLVLSDKKTPQMFAYLKFLQEFCIRKNTPQADSLTPFQSLYRPNYYDLKYTTQHESISQERAHEGHLDGRCACARSGRQRCAHQN